MYMCLLLLVLLTEAVQAGLEPGHPGPQPNSRDVLRHTMIIVLFYYYYITITSYYYLLLLYYYRNNDYYHTMNNINV